jgi:phosphotriesterase-related protein
LKGRIQTVTGDIDPRELGITMTHEHSLINLLCFYSTPEDSSRRRLADKKVAMDILGELHRDPFLCKDNMILNDKSLAATELMYYKRAGGGAIVDLTNCGIARNPLALREISVKTGLKVVMGAGYYVKLSHPPDFEAKTVDDIAAEIVKDIVEGVGKTGINAGMIGEIGTMYPISKNEEKSLRGAARAGLQTGTTVNIHSYCGFPKNTAKYAYKLLDIMEDEGVDLSRVVLSHMDEINDCNVFDMDVHRTLAKRGAYIEYDCFGQENTWDNDGVWEARDIDRAHALVKMVEAGYEKQMLISHDVCYKMHLKKYGGFGYDHILKRIVPLLRKLGLSQKQLDTIMVENPRRILTIQ